MNGREIRFGIGGVLCVVLIAVLAGSWAQAESPPAWMLAPPVSGDIGSELPLELAAEAEGPLALLGHAIGKELNITCQALTSEGVLLKTAGASSGKLIFSGCKVTTNGGEVLPACEPHIGTEKGVIKTVALKGSIVLSEGKPLERIVPVEGTKFVTIETTSSCAFGEKIPILGTLTPKTQTANSKSKSPSTASKRARSPNYG